MKSAASAALTLTLLAGACGDGDRTNCAIARERLDRCFACGDAAMLAGSVSVAVADGARAGIGAHASLIFK